MIFTIIFDLSVCPNRKSKQCPRFNGDLTTALLEHGHDRYICSIGDVGFDSRLEQ